jgi:hypothetical protein
MFSDDKGQSLTNTDLFAARLILDYVYLARPTVPNQGVDTFTHNTKVYMGLRGRLEKCWVSEDLNPTYGWSEPP